ncbi:hypothetical protein APY03_7084 [Variovorax sp. WDL1]|nr:hypothetical protein APY03_7084 [Variovorax sp. WDL1]
MLPIFLKVAASMTLTVFDPSSATQTFPAAAEVEQAAARTAICATASTTQYDELS